MFDCVAWDKDLSSELKLSNYIFVAIEIGTFHIGKEFSATVTQLDKAVACVNILAVSP